MIKQEIENDLKSAMLSGDKDLTTTLRTIKSVILDAEITEGVRDTGLAEDKIITLLIKESKKRQDSAEIYKQAGETSREKKELDEKEIIAKYLPTMMGEEAILVIAKEVIGSIEEPGMKNMGQIIGAVKGKAGVIADGGLIAKIVKDLLNQ